MESTHQSNSTDATWQCILEDYQIKNLIGAGSYGEVMKAKHKQSQIKVAIKKINIPVNASIHLYKCIIREISILRQLSKRSSNKFTALLLDVIVSEHELANSSVRSIYLVMDYWQHTLKSMVDSDPDNFSPDHLTVIVYNLLCSVNYLHSANVIHRDIKPSNILMRADCTIRICDFGLSRTLEEDMSQTNNQAKRELSPCVYTRYYRPPEVILCSDYGFKADLWSIGCIIAELALKASGEGDIGKCVLFPGKACHPLSPCLNIMPQY